MILKDRLRAEIDKGFNKRDLEILIGLPKNCLSYVLRGEGKLSKKSVIKSTRFLDENTELDPFDEKLVSAIKLIKDNNKPENKKSIKSERNNTNNVKADYSLTTSEVINLSEKPIRIEGEKALDFNIRLAEWQENKNK